MEKTKTFSNNASERRFAQFARYASMLVEVRKWEEGKLISHTDAEAIKKILEKYK